MAWYRQVKSPAKSTGGLHSCSSGSGFSAQCHHHPLSAGARRITGDWAFFSQVSYCPGLSWEETWCIDAGNAPGDQHKRRQASPPAGLGDPISGLSPGSGSAKPWPVDDQPREPASSPGALVNRYWKHFFSIRGLIDPEDDVRDTNPATNPELL